jgi:DNA-binding transcriptional ArsR family regulator
MKRASQKKASAGLEDPGEDPHVPQRASISPLKSDPDTCRSAATLAKGLSDENRLRILLCLIGKKKSVTSIVEEVGLSQPLVSHHLKELKRCLLVNIERRGPFIYYEPADPRVFEVVRTLSLIAADLVAARKTL